MNASNWENQVFMIEYQFQEYTKQPTLHWVLLKINH